MRKTSLLLVITAVTLGLFAYANAAQIKTLTIGFTGMLSGPYAKMGKECLVGTQLAVEEINAAGGVKVGETTYKFEIKPLDDEYKAANAVANCRRFVAEGLKIVWVFGSGGNLATQKINQESGKEFLILGMTSTPSATQQGNKLYIRAGGHSDLYVHVAGEAIAKVWPEINNAGVVYGVEPASREWYDKFKASWERLGKKTVTAEMVNPKETKDFYPVLTKVLKANPEIIVITMSDEPAGLIIKQANELGYKNKFFVAEWASLSLPKYCGAPGNIEGRVVLQAPSSFEFPQKYQAFEEKFMAKSGGITPGPVGADGYDGIWTLAHAIKKAGSVNDVWAIRKSIPEVMPIPQRQAAMIGYDETGNSDCRLAFARYVNGKWEGVALATVLADGTVKEITSVK
jgi:branched-chain amino acid transport system substrate-binding protein